MFVVLFVSAEFSLDLSINAAILFGSNNSFFSNSETCLISVSIFSGFCFFSYLRDEKFNLVVIYLFFLSIILEVAHLVISERSFQIEDLIGNILGVLIGYTIVLIYKFWRR